VQVDRRIDDGDTIRVGPIAITAHITAGHTRGRTSYSFSVQDGERTLNVVSACSLSVLGVVRYPQQRADFERAFRVLRGLPIDIWVTSHARPWGRYRKCVASDTAQDRVAPSIDREGYPAYVDTGAARVRRGHVQ
jgi:metallo-beta-lactamase class B